MGMRSQFQITGNGIKIKKLIGSRTIPFAEVGSILLLDEGLFFTTRSGEEIGPAEGDMTSLYKAVVANNLSFRDETENEERYYTREELNPLIAAAAKVATETADAFVKEHLGADYGIVAEFLEEPKEISLCFILLQNGNVVTKLPPDVQDQDPTRMPGCCDSMSLAWLNEWDSGSCSGRYGIVEELKDLEVCRKTQLSSMEFVVGVLKGE